MPDPNSLPKSAAWRPWFWIVQAFGFLPGILPLPFLSSVSTHTIGGRTVIVLLFFALVITIPSATIIDGFLLLKFRGERQLRWPAIFFIIGLIICLAEIFLLTASMWWFSSILHQVSSFK